MGLGPRKEMEGPKSSVPGVSWDKRAKNWRVKFMPPKRDGVEERSYINVGRFQDLASAEAAAKEKAREIREQFPSQVRGIKWNKKQNCWAIETLCCFQRITFIVKSKGSSDTEVKEAYKLAMQKLQEKKDLIQAQQAGQVKEALPKSKVPGVHCRPQLPTKKWHVYFKTRTGPINGGTFAEQTAAERASQASQCRGGQSWRVEGLGTKKIWAYLRTEKKYILFSFSHFPNHASST